jgi:hypothetical protein
MGIVDDAPHPPRRLAEDWLAKKDATERKHRARVDHWTLVFAAIGAFAGAIGVALALWHR